MTTVAIAGQTFTFGVGLWSQADTKDLQANPTIAAGDFQESTNGAAFNNLDNLPTVTPAAGTRVQIILSVAETTAAAAGGEIWVRWVDQAGAEWCDGYVVVKVHADEMDVPDIADAVWDEALAGHAAAGTTGAALGDIEGCTCGGGAIEFTYTVTDTSTGLPLEGVEVWISTDAAGANRIWYGTTDAFGVARSAGGTLPMLDAGTYYFWSQLGGYYFSNPDTEVVS